MKLLRLHIENFGALHDFSLSLSDGLNVLYQKNGWGKTTLAVFIKAMFYGLPATSKRSLDENERKKYAPWQGGAYGGSLDFEIADGKFRIERFFAAKESGDSFALFDLSSNKPSDRFSYRLGEELFGIDADGFERSTYLSQRAIDEGKDNNSIAAKLGNLLDDVGDIGNFDTAIEALEKRRRYYVMSGNRGAIADVERESAETLAEAERCARVKEAVTEQENRLAATLDEIRALKKLLEETRSRLEKAGLARERAAFLEQKAQMLDELASLTAQKKTHDSFLGEVPPTDAELLENRELYDSIKASSVRLDTLSAESADARELAELEAHYPNGLPSVASLDRVEAANEEIRRITARADALRGAHDADELPRRFPNGAPAPNEIEQGFDAIERSEALQKMIGSLVIPSEKAPLSPPLALIAILLAAGVASAVFALIALTQSTLSALFLPFLLVGIVGVGMGALLGGMRSGKKKKLRETRQTLLGKRREWSERRERELKSVRDLLSRYRMPIHADDLSRAMTELALLSKQYREGKEKRRRITEELTSLESARTEQSTRVHAFLCRYQGDLAQKEDYRADIDEMRRAAHQYERLQLAKKRRTEEIAQEKRDLEMLKAKLLPFLRRFDSAGKWRAGECLTKIGEHLAEQTRLAALIAQKERSLRHFIVEKNLDGQSDSVDVGAYERLSAEEKTLRERLADLQKRHTVLKGEIDRLSIDADRLPELLEQQSRLKQKADELRENAATIANTEKFLEEAKVSLSTRYLGGMQEAFCHYFRLLTGEDAPEAMMDTSFDIRLRQGGQTRSMESFSRGWRDTVRFCVRLSLASALYADGEKPFFLLDDPFVNLDDGRLENARELLDRLAKEYQILHLVCHKDRV